MFIKVRNYMKNNKLEICIYLLKFSQT